MSTNLLDRSESTIAASNDIAASGEIQQTENIDLIANNELVISNNENLELPSEDGLASENIPEAIDEARMTNEEFFAALREGLTAETGLDQNHENTNTNQDASSADNTNQESSSTSNDSSLEASSTDNDASQEESSADNNSSQEASSTENGVSSTTVGLGSAGGGSSQGFIEVTVFDSFYNLTDTQTSANRSALNSINTNRMENNQAQRTESANNQNHNTTPTNTNTNTNPPSDTSTNSIPEASMPEVSTVEPPEVAPEVVPEVTPEPENVILPTNNDVFVMDAGSRIFGNLLENDNLPEGTLISQVLAPENWTSTENEDGSVTFVSADGSIIFEVETNGDFELITSINNVNFDDINFNYTAIDPENQSYSANITVGNNGNANLSVEHLEGGSAIVTNNDTGNTYEQLFSSHADDTELGNQHVNGMLLGDGDDTITVETAIGSQTDPFYASSAGDDTFIYGDNLNNNTPGVLGDDIINIGTLDGTKVRADGNLFDGVEGGDDTVNVDTMEGGSIFGDGWHLYAGSQGGDDTINVGEMNSGHIYGDGVVEYGHNQGGDDNITINTIDTTANGSQQVIINGGSGNDIISIDNINMHGNDSVNINGGLGDDIFNFNDSANNTMAIRGDNIYISGNNASITNFEGVSTGGGDDLLKLYSGTEDIISVDTGEGMDVLLAGANDLAGITNMINNGSIYNTEVIVLNNGLNNSSTTSTENLFNKLEDEGVNKNGEEISFDDTWTKSETSIGNYDEYTSQDGDMTILIAKTQMENAVV